MSGKGQAEKCIKGEGGPQWDGCSNLWLTFFPLSCQEPWMYRGGDANGKATLGRIWSHGSHLQNCNTANQPPASFPHIRTLPGLLKADLCGSQAETFSWGAAPVSLCTAPILNAWRFLKSTSFWPFDTPPFWKCCDVTNILQMLAQLLLFSGNAMCRDGATQWGLLLYLEILIFGPVHSASVQLTCAAFVLVCVLMVQQRVGCMVFTSTGARTVWVAHLVWTQLYGYWSKEERKDLWQLPELTKACVGLIW